MDVVDGNYLLGLRVTCGAQVFISDTVPLLIDRKLPAVIPLLVLPLTRTLTIGGLVGAWFTENVDCHETKVQVNIVGGASLIEKEQFQVICSDNRIQIVTFLQKEPAQVR